VTAEPHTAPSLRFARALSSGASAPVIAVRRERGKAAVCARASLCALEAGVTVDPLAVIGPRAEVGAGTVIGAGAGDRSGRGDRPRLRAVGANATITHALIGDRVNRVTPDAHRSETGSAICPVRGCHQKIPQRAAHHPRTTSRSVPMPRLTPARPVTRSSGRHQDRQSCANRAQRHRRTALSDRRSSRHIRQL